jgi:hypothetical protein
MYFLGSANRTRGRREKVTELIISFSGLDPDGCLGADQRKVYAKHLKYRVQINKRVTSALVGDPAKKQYHFCDGQVFSIDRDLLMGA